MGSKGVVVITIRDVVSRAGRIDVLVNNAGYGYMGLLESFSVEQAQRIFDTNVFGAHPLLPLRFPCHCRCRAIS